MFGGFYLDGKLYYKKPTYWTLKNPKLKGESEMSGGEFIIYNVINKDNCINGKYYEFILDNNKVKIIDQN